MRKMNAEERRGRKKRTKGSQSGRKLPVYEEIWEIALSGVLGQGWLASKIWGDAERKEVEL